jgi:hypothetical protein
MDFRVVSGTLPVVVSRRGRDRRLALITENVKNVTVYLQAQFTTAFWSIHEQWPQVLTYGQLLPKQSAVSYFEGNAVNYLCCAILSVLIGRASLRLEDNIKMDLRWVEWGDMDWFVVAQDRER